MEGSRLERLSPHSGIVGVVPILAAAVLAGFFDYLRPAGAVSAYFNARATQAGLGHSRIVATCARAGAPGGISPTVAITLYDLSTSVQGGLYGVTLAVMFEATAVVAFRYRTPPVWFGWVSSILALLLLTPFGYIGLFVAPIWLVGVSLWLYARRWTAGGDQP